jgi:hypothetical protein
VAREPQRPRLVSFLRARAFAARLDVDPWAASICLSCLSFVVFPLDSGDSAVARVLVLRLAEVEVQRIRVEWRGRMAAPTPPLRAPPGVEPTRLR